MEPSVTRLAKEWLRLDKDSTTREEIYQLLKAGAHSELETRLRKRIAFGTAGLRGPMQAGFSCLNSLTIIQASQGLAAYLLEKVPSAKERGVVIGRDARHNSTKFASLAAAAFVRRGIKVWWYESPSHTPMVPFGVMELNAAAGVMVTASHNPKMDNGYKVYWENGCQIIPPHDQRIAEAIEANLEPLSWDQGVVDEGNLLVEGALEHVKDKYFHAVNAACCAGDSLQGEELPSIKFVFTPMHGVGLPAMKRAVIELELIDGMIVVQEQAEPDPEFPTVKFPNPEEKGALNLAVRTADGNSISLIIAVDPDADRLAVAEKVDGRWHQFTGNQLGILLASYIFTVQSSSKQREKLAMLASTVSSSMLASMAHNEGFHFEETLTGFKWLGNEGLSLEQKGYHTAFAFEEAIGYMIPSVVYDKDGIAAASVFLTAARYWQSREKLTPWAKLQELYSRYGHFEDANTYLVSPSPAITNRVFDDIRTLGDPHPTHLGNLKIHKWRDLTIGYDSETKDHRPLLPVSENSQMITCELHGGARFTVRGSGTEPKIKLYIEGKADTAAKAKDVAKEVLEELLERWLNPEEYGLKLA